MKILLIEDDPGTLEAIRFCLEVYIPGVNVISTTLGHEGLRICKYTAPDLVILDLNLSDIESMQVLGSIRKTSDLPVIVISEADDDEKIPQARKLGASEDIIEPFDSVDLLTRIDKLLRERGIQPKIQLLPGEPKTNITG